MAEAISSSPSTRVAVVTGGNKGIRLEVCRQLASNGVTVVLTSRDEKRGVEAVEKLKEAGLSNVLFHQLDVTDARSIVLLADFLKVNNAAVGGAEPAYQDPVDSSVTSQEKYIGMDVRQMVEFLRNISRETYGTAKQCVETNYYGTKHVIEAMLALLQTSSDGRIVNVSSDFGQLRVVNEELKQELDDVDNLTEERLDELLGNFLKDFEAGDAEARGWPTMFSAYKVAKATMTSYSRILAKRHPELRINCVHPGYTRTDLTLFTGLLTPDEGASNVTKVALLPADGPTGTFFVLGEEASFV